MKHKHLLNTLLLLGGLFCVAGSHALAAEDDTEAAFKKAMGARDAGDILGSIEIFQTILGMEPSLHRARLELAVAYYRAIQYAEAERQAKEVLDDPDTPQSVRLSVLAFLAQVKAEHERFIAERHSFRPSIAIGYLHDDNVNVGPTSDVINIGTATLRLAPGSSPQSDDAFTLSATLNHSFKTGKLVNIAGKSAAVLWQSQAALYTRQYDELSEFNLDVVSLSTGPAFIVPKQWRGTVSLRADHIELGSERLALYLSVLPSVTWQLNNTTELSLNASLVDRDFKQAVDEGRDSDYRSIGLTLGKRYVANKVSVQGGIALFNEDANNDVFSRDGTQIFVGANWEAWKDGSLYANFSQRDYKHDDPEPLFNEKRDEREQQFVIGARHEFKDGYLNKWVLSGDYKYTDNSSNVDIFEFDRELISASFSRTF